MEQGKVYLVGAGPGDPGLLTVRGLECLRRADVILYDRLVDETVLDNARPEARRIDVGKPPREGGTEQKAIDNLLVAEASRGNLVVRLKGGDPFVFGRGGEEAEVLARNGIPFEVVPGVSSVTAVPAYAGIPVTHRLMASSFAVVTGQESRSKLQPAVRWDRLAGAADTLVILMGIGNLDSTVTELLHGGLDPRTPVAVIRDGTRPSQETVTGPLSDIVQKVRAAGLGPPAIVVVGEVVRLRDSLQWFDCLPLIGKRVLVTRAQAQAQSLSNLLREHGAIPVVMSTIDIREPSSTGDLDRAISSLNDYQWIVFTSTNGVGAFMGRLFALGKDARSLHGLRTGAIGEATSAALTERGIRADYVPHEFTSAGFLAGLEGQDVAGRCFLLPRSDLATRQLPDGLTRLGAKVHEVEVYRTVPSTTGVTRARRMLTEGQIDVITLTSSSTARNLVSLLDDGLQTLRNSVVACIGPVTATSAAEAGLKVDIVATEHTIPGLVEAIVGYFKSRGSATNE